MKLAVNFMKFHEVFRHFDSWNFSRQPHCGVPKNPAHVLQEGAKTHHIQFQTGDAHFDYHITYTDITKRVGKVELVMSFLHSLLCIDIDMKSDDMQQNLILRIPSYHVTTTLISYLQCIKQILLMLLRYNKTFFFFSPMILYISPPKKESIPSFIVNRNAFILHVMCTVQCCTLTDVKIFLKKKIYKRFECL